MTDENTIMVESEYEIISMDGKLKGFVNITDLNYKLQENIKLKHDKSINTYFSVSCR